MKLGLTRTDLEDIKAILSQYKGIEEAFVFGSRAKGNYKNGSDVDIALKGKRIPFTTVISISSKLNVETLMPYHFDVLNYAGIDNKDLAEHIDRVGIKIYKKPSK